MKSEAGDTVRSAERVLLEAVNRVCYSLDILDAHLPFVTEHELQKIASPGGSEKRRLVSISSDDALLLVRLYLRLTTLMGSDEAGKNWLRSFNTVLNDRPINLLSSGSGLLRVVDYLESA